MDKRPFILQDRSMGFNKAEYKKFTDMVSYSTSWLPLRNYHLLNFDVVLKKNIHNALKMF